MKSPKPVIFILVFLSLIGLVKTVSAATEFVTTVNTDGGGDYPTLFAWEAAINTDLTASSTKVYSVSSLTGTVADGNTVTGGTSYHY